MGRVTLLAIGVPSARQSSWTFVELGSARVRVAQAQRDGRGRAVGPEHARRIEADPEAGCNLQERGVVAGVARFGEQREPAFGGGATPSRQMATDGALQPLGPRSIEAPRAHQPRFEVVNL